MDQNQPLDLSLKPRLAASDLSLPVTPLNLKISHLNDRSSESPNSSGSSSFSISPRQDDSADMMTSDDSSSDDARDVSRSQSHHPRPVTINTILVCLSPTSITLIIITNNQLTTTTTTAAATADNSLTS